MRYQRILFPLLCILLLSSCCTRSVQAGDQAKQPDVQPTGYLAMSEDGEHPQLIAHAGGAIYGYRLTNSLEALDTAYSSGFRYIELDMSLTSDGYIALIHDWESMANRMLFSPGVRTKEEFLSCETLADLTLLDLDLLLLWLEEHPDCYIVTDVKETSNLAVLELIRDEVEDMGKCFIPQVYSFEEYEGAVELGYEQVILTLYRLDPDVESLREFAQEHKPWAITMPENRVSKEMLDAVADSGVAVYAHTINSLDFFEMWVDCGLTGIYTDYFIPNQWVY